MLGSFSKKKKKQNRFSLKKAFQIFPGIEFECEIFPSFPISNLKLLKVLSSIWNSSIIFSLTV